MSVVNLNIVNFIYILHLLLFLKILNSDYMDLLLLLRTYNYLFAIYVYTLYVYIYICLMFDVGAQSLFAFDLLTWLKHRLTRLFDALTSLECTHIPYTSNTHTQLSRISICPRFDVLWYLLVTIFKYNNKFN